MTASGNRSTYEASHVDVAWAIMHALLNEPFHTFSVVDDFNLEALSIETDLNLGPARRPGTGQDSGKPRLSTENVNG